MPAGRRWIVGLTTGETFLVEKSKGWRYSVIFVLPLEDVYTLLLNFGVANSDIPRMPGATAFCSKLINLA